MKAFIQLKIETDWRIYASVNQAIIRPVAPFTNMV